MKDRPIISHLEELRTRLIAVVVIVVIAFFIIFSYGDFFTGLLLAPLQEYFGDGQVNGALGKIVYIGLLDKILSQFQLSLWGALLLSSPLWFHQIWLFIKPALYDNETKYVRLFIILGFTLFSFGGGFGYYFIFPMVIKTFTTFGISGIEANINLKDYIILASKFLFLCGIVFQIPNVIVLLGFLGIADSKSLKAKRSYIYVGFCIASGMITPPDVVSLLMLWLPLSILFEVGLLASSLIIRQKKTNQ